MEGTDVAIAAPSAESLLRLLPELPQDVQLDRVLGLLSAADECAERLDQLTSEAWHYMVENRLWEAGSMSLEEVKARINYVDVCKRVERHGRTTKRKEGDVASIRKLWGCSPEELLPAEHWPSNPSLLLLRSLRQLSQTASVEGARHVLMDAVRWRLQQPGRRTTKELQAGDAQRAIDQVKALEGGPQIDSEAAAMASPPPQRQQPPPPPSEEKRREDVGTRSYTDCRCPSSLHGCFPPAKTRLSDEEGLALLKEARKGAGLFALCQPHLRVLAAAGLGLYNNKTQAKLCRRLEHVYWHRSKLERLRQKTKPHWFRRSRRAAIPQDLRSACRYARVQGAGFDFDPVQVFERFGGSGSWEAWQLDGTINVPGVFSYLNQADLKEMIDIEFAIYRHHHHTPAGTSRLGWLRNMYYSLVQQLVRQDPGYYALTAAARPDRGWRLISYPYISKDTDSGGESTGFLHMDLDLEGYLADGRGSSRLTSSVSIDDEDSLGCTVAVKGFHRHVREWHTRLLKRGWKGSGPTTNCSGVYTAEDRAEWGSAVGVPCGAWGIRMTLPQVIHGSTQTSVRRRRTILPWFMHIDEDHEQLEVAGCLRWSEVRRCHLDLEVPRVDPSGYGPRLGAPKERFGGSVVLGSTSAVGDALVGRRKWTDAEVLRERDVLLGPDSAAAGEYVGEVRSRLVSQYRLGFSSMVRTEQEQYLGGSYFAAEEQQDDSGGSESDSTVSSLDAPSSQESGEEAESEAEEGGAGAEEAGEAVAEAG